MQIGSISQYKIATVKDNIDLSVLRLYGNVALGNQQAVLVLDI